MFLWLFNVYYFLQLADGISFIATLLFLVGMQRTEGGERRRKDICPGKGNRLETDKLRKIFVVTV